MAEVTTKAPEAPAPRATTVIPTDGFHDSREVAVAEAQGLPTTQGYPLQPAAQEILRELRTGLDGVRQWLDYANVQLGRAAAIGGTPQ